MENSIKNTGFPEKFGESPDDFLKKYELFIYKIIHEKVGGRLPVGSRMPVRGRLPVGGQLPVGNNPELEVEDLFNDFFVHISGNGFERLRQYRGEGKPHHYLGRILRNFICDKFREKKLKSKVRFKLTDQSLYELKGENVPENIVSLLKALKNKLYKDERQFVAALKNTIGEEDTNSWKPLILNSARINSSPITVISIEEIDIPSEPTHEEMLISTEKSELIKDALKETSSCLSERENLIRTCTYIKKWDAQRVADLLGVETSCIYESNRKVRKIFAKKLEERGIKINEGRREKRKKTTKS